MTDCAGLQLTVKSAVSQSPMSCLQTACQKPKEIQFINLIETANHHIGEAGTSQSFAFLLNKSLPSSEMLSINVMLTN